MKNILTRSTGILLAVALILAGCGTSAKINYVAPTGIKSQEMEFKWPDGELTISGVLLTPGQYEKLAIILPAEGPGRRYSEGKLIDSLLDAGIAVLSYDERGQGKSTGTYDGSNYFDLAADVTLIARNLRRALGPDVRIGTIGIGDGGFKGMIAAHYDRRIEFMVMLGTPGVPGDLWVEHQALASPKSWRLKKEKPEMTFKYIREINQILKRRQSENDQLEQLETYLTALKVSKKKKSRFSDPLFRSLVNISTDQFAGKNMARTLVLLRENEQEIDVKSNVEAWEQVADRTGRVELRLLSAAGGSATDELTAEEIRSLTIWILGQPSTR